MLHIFKHLISPPICFGCKAEIGSWYTLCEVCLSEIEPLAPHDISVTKKYMMRVYSLGKYEHILARAIAQKFGRSPFIWRLLAHLMVKETILAHRSYDYVVPIPMHWTRWLWRGSNHAAVLAQEISYLTKIPMMSALKKIKRGPRQATLSRAIRLQNTKNTFEFLQQKEIQNKRILLIDDVCTTGATLHAAAKTILQGKPFTVDALVVGRTIYGKS